MTRRSRQALLPEMQVHGGRQHRARRVALIAAAALPLVLWHAGATTPEGAIVIGVVAIGGVLAASRRVDEAEARGAARASGAEREAADRARASDAAARMVAATLDAIPDAILEIDEAGKVVRANAAAREMFAVEPGAPLLSVVRDPDILAGIDDVLAGREAADIPFARPGSVERHFVVHVLRLDLGAAARSRAIVLYRDVTALRNADRLRADFVANVSHEMRTPLASLSGFIETLRGPARDDEPARLRFLEIMEGEARRMTRLVSDLLSLSRIEASEHAAPTDAVDIGPVVARVANALGPVARARRISIAVDMAPGLPAVAGDGDQLQQVLQNLVDNAIKYG
ncbi:MAG: histidine kinase dimerization/phospho-acceptor domain-containing protein, partial [Alphaproteobacteria bacterium]